MMWHFKRTFSLYREGHYSGETEGCTTPGAAPANQGPRLVVARGYLPHCRQFRWHPGGGSLRWQGRRQASTSRGRRLAVATPPPASGPTLIPLAVYTLHLARSTLGSSLPKLLRRLLRPGNFLVAAPASLPVPGPCGSCSHRGLGSGLPC